MKGRHRLFLLMTALGIFSSCNSERLFEEHQGMELLHWAVQDTVSFEVEGLDPQSAVPILNIRYNDTYEFHNLYVRYLLRDSLGTVLGDSLINVSLFDSKTGQPLGDGFGNIFTKHDTLPRILTSVQPKLKIQFVQYMRKDELEGIEAVGLKINKK